MQEMHEDHDLWSGPPPEFMRVAMRRLSHQWAATASSAKTASTKHTKNAIGSRACH